MVVLAAQSTTQREKTVPLRREHQIVDVRVTVEQLCVSLLNHKIHLNLWIVCLERG
jgi:hypothetical protein